MPALALLALGAPIARGCGRRASRGLGDVVRDTERDAVGHGGRRIVRGGVLADEPLAAQLRHACGLAGLVVGRGGALVLALGLALLLDALLDRGGLGLVALRLLALELQLGLDALLLEDGQALLQLVELCLLGKRLLGRLLGVGERALGGPKLQLDLGGALRVLGDDSVHLGEHGERSFLSGGEDPLRHVHVFGGIDREADIGQPVVVEDVLAGGTRPTGRGRSRWSPGSRVGRRRRRGAGPGWPPPCRRCACRRR